MPQPIEVRFLAGGVELAGELLLPDPTPEAPKPRWPWALLLPSWLPRDRDGRYDATGHPGWFAAPPATAPPGLLARLAMALAEAGVASFRYDTRGCGASGGDWARSDLFTRIDDARDAIGAMRSRPELDLARTGIVAHGEGAVIGLSVAIADPVVGALTLVGSPARSLRHALRRGAPARLRRKVDRDELFVVALDRAAEELIERAARHEPGMTLHLGSGPRIELSLAGWEQAFQTPALALATMLHRSVTLVHGERDAWSHPDETRLLGSALASGGNEPQLRLVPRAGHDLADAPDALFEALARDLVARLEPRELPPVLIALEERS